MEREEPSRMDVDPVLVYQVDLAGNQSASPVAVAELALLCLTMLLPDRSSQTHGDP